MLQSKPAHPPLPLKAAGPVQNTPDSLVTRTTGVLLAHTELPVVKLFPLAQPAVTQGRFKSHSGAAGTGEQLVPILWRTRGGRPSVRPQKRGGGGRECGSEPSLTPTQSNGPEWNVTEVDRSQTSTSMYNGTQCKEHASSTCVCSFRSCPMMKIDMMWGAHVLQKTMWLSPFKKDSSHAVLTTILFLLTPLFSAHWIYPSSISSVGQQRVCVGLGLARVARSPESSERSHSTRTHLQACVSWKLAA